MPRSLTVLIGAMLAFAAIPAVPTVQAMPDPKVSLVLTDGAFGEPGLPDVAASFTLSRTGSTASAMNVKIAYSGSATPGVDYEALSTLLTIPAGQASATFPVTPLHDTIDERSETIRVKILPDTPNYYLNSAWDSGTPLGGGNAILAVWGYSEEVWAGSSKWTSPFVYKMHHFNGQSWDAPVDIPGSDNIRAIHGTSPSNIWVGRDGGDLVRYDGLTWTSTGNIGQSIASIHAFSTTDVWATSTNGQNKIWHWDGASWTAHIVTGGNGGQFFGLWGASPTDIWAATATRDLYHWTGSTWNFHTTLPSSTSGLDDIWGVDSNNVWVLGGQTGSNAVIHKWDGTTWRAATTISTTVDGYELEGFSGNDMWVVGGSGSTFHWDGATWNNEGTAPVAVLYDVAGADSNDLYAGGFSDRIFHFGPTADTITLTLLDNDDPIMTLAKQSDGAEPSTAGVLTVARPAGQNQLPITVTFTLGGTATPAADYTAPSTTLDFVSGENSKTVNFPVLDDGTSEGTETITVTPATCTECTFASASAITIPILDNDGPNLAVSGIYDAQGAQVPKPWGDWNAAPGNVGSGTTYLKAVNTGTAPGDVKVTLQPMVLGASSIPVAGKVTFVSGSGAKPADVASWATISNDADGIAVLSVPATGTPLWITYSIQLPSILSDGSFSGPHDLCRMGVDPGC